MSFLADAPRCDRCGYVLARCCCQPSAARTVTAPPAPARRTPGPEPSAPCGTASAARRHYRRGEPPCEACRIAVARDKADRAGRPQAPVKSPDMRAVRNDLPVVLRYAWRSRAYPWAQRVIDAAEAVHGAPVPSCMRCTRPVHESGSVYPADGLCDTCRDEMEGTR